MLPLRAPRRPTALPAALALALAPLACYEGAAGPGDGGGSSGGASEGASTSGVSAGSTSAPSGMSSWTGSTSSDASGSTAGEGTSSGGEGTSSSGGVDPTTSSATTATTSTSGGDDTTGWATIGDGLSFAAEVFPIIMARCSCHKASYPDAPTAWAALVYKPSMGVPELTLVVPFDVDASYLLHKLKNTQGEVGGLGVQMPPSNPLSGAELAIFDTWVAEGAAP